MTKTIRYSLAIAGCLASLGIAAAPAVAADKNLGTTQAGIVDLSKGDVGNGGNFVAPSTTFSDNYFFRLVDGGLGDFNLLNAAVSGKKGFAYNIKNLTAVLYDLTTSTTVGNLIGTTDPDATTRFTLAVGDSYRIGVSGTATGSKGGLYAVSVTPLPGPAGWAVALAGGGMLAFGVRRRRNRDKQAMTAA